MVFRQIIASVHAEIRYQIKNQQEIMHHQYPIEVSDQKKAANRVLIPIGS